MNSSSSRPRVMSRPLGCPILAAAFSIFFSTAATVLAQSGTAREGRTVQASATAVAVVRHDQVTALDRYVVAPDTNYSFRLITSAKTPTGNVHVLEMTSQSWLTTNEVNRTIWKHWLTIICPNQINSSTGMMVIAGGSNDKEIPNTPELALRRVDGNLVRMAVETKSVAAELHHVPNQPLIFGNDGQPRTEDNLIAYTWDKFLRTGDERWPARLPMTKSAVRAMDTITAFCATPEGGSAKVDRFMVAGGSKRGWTTWTTAAVDPRVVAIVPIVIDVLHLEPSMLHHYAAYGFWAPAINDYEQQHIMDWFGTPQNRALARIEDPYEYRQRYTMPKLVLNDTGDQFFLPDSSQFYYDALPEPKLLRYVPNTDHSMKGSDAWETVQAFYQYIQKSAALPRYSWSFEKDGSIKVKAANPPEEVKLWQATNPDARDFRMETLGPKWTSTELTHENGGYLGRVPEPAKGWTAFMIELTFKAPEGKTLKLTTPVRVLPDKTNFKFAPAARASASR